VSVASNFERLQWSVLNGCGNKVARNMERLEEDGRIQLEQDEWLQARKLFDSLAVEDADAFNSIHEVFVQSGYLVSPPTAIGLRAARVSRRSLLIPMICLATTHPSISDAGLQRLSSDSCISIPNDIAALVQFIDDLSKDTESRLL
jgi:threonine synthase